MRKSRLSFDDASELAYLIKGNKIQSIFYKYHQMSGNLNNASSVYNEAFDDIMLALLSYKQVKFDKTFYLDMIEKYYDCEGRSPEETFKVILHQLGISTKKYFDDKKHFWILTDKYNNILRMRHINNGQVCLYELRELARIWQRYFRDSQKIPTYVRKVYEKDIIKNIGKV